MAWRIFFEHSPGICILTSVQRLRIFLVLALAAFYPLAASHCLWESVSGLALIECAEDASRSDCAGDECSTIESASYRSEDQQLAFVHVGTVDLLPAEAYALNFSAPVLVELLPSALAPPELSPRWQFVFRTAAPPRAPSVVS